MKLFIRHAEFIMKVFIIVQARTQTFEMGVCEILAILKSGVQILRKLGV